MKKLLFIINPKAGRTAIKTDLFEIIMTFADAGYEVVTYPTTGPEDAERKVIADGADYDLIVCAGGDGTLENTICGYMNMGEKKVPIGYIPVGTTNDFARSLKISRKPLVAANQIVGGKKKLIDVGSLDDKYFIYIAAFGIFTDISYSTNQQLKKVMGHSAYVLEGIRNITNFKTYNIEAQLDDALITGEYIYGMITNSFSVAGFKIRGTKYVVLDDGKFDCLFIKKPQNITELQQIVSSMLTNNLDDMEENEMFFSCKASRVKIKCDKPIAWTVDGEYGGDKTEVDIINHRQAVSIYLDENYELYSSEEVEDMLAATDENSDQNVNDNMTYDPDADDDYFDSWD